MAAFVYEPVTATKSKLIMNLLKLEDKSNGITSTPIFQTKHPLGEKLFLHVKSKRESVGISSGITGT